MNSNLTLNPFDKIIIRTLQDGNSYNFYSPGFFYVIWTEEGTGKIEINNSIKEFATAEFFLVPPEVPFIIRAVENSPAYCIALSIEYLQVEAKVFSVDIFKLFISHSVHSSLQVEEIVFTRINKIKDILIDLASDKKIAFPILYYQFNSILLLLIQTNNLYLSIPDKNIERMHDFFVLVYKNCLKEKNVSFYAKELNISSKRLNQILHIFLSHSASYFIQENIIMEAKRRLLSGKLNINEIAFELGYIDVAYFSRFFKKWTGMPPEKYRKQLINSLI